MMHNHQSYAIAKWYVCKRSPILIKKLRLITSAAEGKYTKVQKVQKRRDFTFAASRKLLITTLSYEL